MNAKNKRVYKKPTSAGQEPMFVKLILNNIWEVYNSISNRESEKIEKIIKNLNLSIPPKELRMTDRESTKILVQSIMSKWLPLPHSVLDILGTNLILLPLPLESLSVISLYSLSLRMVVDHLPNPIVAQGNRIIRLIPELSHVKDSDFDSSAAIQGAGGQLRVKMIPPPHFKEQNIMTGSFPSAFLKNKKIK